MHRAYYLKATMKWKWRPEARSVVLETLIIRYLPTVRLTLLPIMLEKDRWHKSDWWGPLSSLIDAKYQSNTTRSSSCSIELSQSEMSLVCFARVYSLLLLSLREENYFSSFALEGSLVWINKKSLGNSQSYWWVDSQIDDQLYFSNDGENERNFLSLPPIDFFLLSFSLSLFSLFFLLITLSGRIR